MPQNASPCSVWRPAGIRSSDFVARIEATYLVRPLGPRHPGNSRAGESPLPQQRLQGRLRRACMMRPPTSSTAPITIPASAVSNRSSNSTSLIDPNEAHRGPLRRHPGAAERDGSLGGQFCLMPRRSPVGRAPVPCASPRSLDPRGRHSAGRRGAGVALTHRPAGAAHAEPPVCGPVDFNIRPWR